MLRCGIKRSHPATAAIADTAVPLPDVPQNAIIPIRLSEISKCVTGEIQFGERHFTEIRSLGRIESVRTTAQGCSFFCSELFTAETVDYLEATSCEDDFDVTRLEDQHCFSTGTPQKVLCLWKQPGLSSGLKPGTVVELCGRVKAYSGQTPPGLLLAEHPMDRPQSSYWRYFELLRTIATAYWKNGFNELANGDEACEWELTGMGSPYDFSGGKK